MTTITRQQVANRITRQFEALNRHDAAAAAAAYTADAVVLDPQYPEPLRGRNAIVKDFEELFGAFPDLEVTEKLTLIEGDAYAIEFTMRGTHKGPLIGPSGHIPATGKRVEFHGGAFGRVDAEARAIEERRSFDLTGMLSQIGLLG